VLTGAAQLLRVAAGLQLLQLPGMIVGQHYLGWRQDLSRLTPVNRRLVVALGVGIVLYVVGTALITLLYPRPMAESALGRALCVLQAAAWSARVLQQVLVIGPLWPTEVRWLHRSLTAIYSLLALGYGVVCWLLLGAPSIVMG
jgi:hypothetical protein